MVTEPIDQPSFSATWSPTTADDDLRRWCDFLAASAVTWTPSEKDRDFVRQVATTGGPHAKTGIELRLCTLAHDVLAQKGDARRLVQHSSGAWYLLSKERLAVLQGKGHVFTRPTSVLASFATIPVTLAAYFGAQAACDAAGLPREWSWLVALGVYAIAHRVLRRRWPLQSPR